VPLPVDRRHSLDEDCYFFSNAIIATIKEPNEMRIAMPGLWLMKSHNLTKLPRDPSSDDRGDRGY
jgi:hypothetical protein